MWVTKKKTSLKKAIDSHQAGKADVTVVSFVPWFHLYMCQGLNYHYFHIIGDGHQPNSRGLYTNYKDSY